MIKLAAEAEQRRLNEARDALVRDFTPMGLPSHVVEQALDTAVRRFERARIREFVPILAEREARSRLRRR